jgi:hypothetical protein
MRNHFLLSIMKSRTQNRKDSLPITEITMVGLVDEVRIATFVCDVECWIQLCFNRLSYLDKLTASGQDGIRR